MKSAQQWMTELAGVSSGEPDDAGIITIKDIKDIQADALELSGAKTREAFEKWISSPPYECDISRWPDVADKSWPGQYHNIATQLAWQAWQEAIRQNQL